MFIQWRRRAYKSGSEAMYAYLATSQRVGGKPKSIIVGYLGSIASDDLAHKDRREAFWQQVHSNLAGHTLTKEELTKLEAAIAQRVPIKGKALATLTSSASQEWYTPPDFVDMAREVLGTIELDPASNERAQQWIQATRYYTNADDGLSQPWYGKTWLNPPYARTKLWVEKAIAEFESGRVSEAILLVKPASGASAYQRLSRRFPECKPDKRIRFIDQNGIQQTRPAHGNAFFYMGINPEQFHRVFSRIGSITAPWSNEVGARCNLRF